MTPNMIFFFSYTRQHCVCVYKWTFFFQVVLLDHKKKLLSFLFFVYEVRWIWVLRFTWKLFEWHILMNDKFWQFLYKKFNSIEIRNVCWFVLFFAIVQLSALEFVELQNTGRIISDVYWSEEVREKKNRRRIYRLTFLTLKQVHLRRLCTIFSLLLLVFLGAIVFRWVRKREHNLSETA